MTRSRRPSVAPRQARTARLSAVQACSVIPGLLTGQFSAGHHSSAVHATAPIRTVATLDCTPCRPRCPHAMPLDRPYEGLDHALATHIMGQSEKENLYP